MLSCSYTLFYRALRINYYEYTTINILQVSVEIIGGSTNLVDGDAANFSLFLTWTEQLRVGEPRGRSAGRPGTWSEARWSLQGPKDAPAHSRHKG